MSIPAFLGIGHLLWYPTPPRWSNIRVFLAIRNRRAFKSPVIHPGCPGLAKLRSIQPHYKTSWSICSLLSISQQADEFYRKHLYSWQKVPHRYYWLSWVGHYQSLKISEVSTQHLICSSQMVPIYHHCKWTAAAWLCHCHIVCGDDAVSYTLVLVRE